MAFFSNKPEGCTDFAISPLSSDLGENSPATSPAPDDHESDMPRAGSFQPVFDQSTVSSTTTSAAGTRDSVDKLKVSGVKPTGLAPEVPSPEDKPTRKTMSYKEVRAERKRMSVLRPGYDRRLPPRGTPGAPNSACPTVARDNTQAASTQAGEMGGGASSRLLTPPHSLATDLS